MSEIDPREEALFQKSLELPREERERYLVSSCRGDPVLRENVLGLLKSHEAGGGFLDSLPDEDSARVAAQLQRIAPADESPGDDIGRYRLLELIGEGSWGSVWMAEQREDIKRRVALKILKLGLDTKDFLARFEAERQMLAMMDHPNIARVLDAGATTYGRPYFVMELVKGMPLLEYADGKRLGIDERVQLFIKICQALQHAHQKGIIHRDIKPSNILVTEQDDEPVPKLIDFGVAKTTEFRLTDKTLFTGLHTFIGTPVYCSPEQLEFSGSEVDNRSDIYSLGALLYELLCGTPPFDQKLLSELSLESMRTIVRERDPPRPSLRFGRLSSDKKVEIAGKRGCPPFKVESRLRGDIDWIVMKCLEKDRNHRYDTANVLAQDLRAFLESRPVSAVAPSVAYRLRKFIHRNRRAYAVWVEAAAILCAVLALVFYLRSGTSEPSLSPEPELIPPRSSARDSSRSIAVLPFENRGKREGDRIFIDGIHDDLVTHISRIPGITTIARTSVLGYRDTAENMRTIGEELSVATILLGGVQRAGGQIKINVQLIDAATDALLWAERYERELTAENIFVIQNKISKAIAGALQVVLSPQESERMEKLPTESLAALEAYFRGKERYHFRSGTAVRESIVHLEEAISLDPDFAMAHAMLGRSYIRNTYYTDLPFNQEVAKAERHILKALELDDTQSEVHVALGTLRDHQGDLAGKESAYKKAVDLNPNNAAAHASYARVRQRRIGSTLEVARLWRKSYELDPNSQNAQGRLASSLAASGQLDEALKVRESVASRNPGSSRALLHLGRFYFYNLGRFDDAIVTFRKQLALDPKHIAPPSYLANAYGNLGDRERAVRWLEWRLKTIVDPVSRAAWRAPLLRFAGDNSLREEQALEELWASPKNRAFWGILARLIDLYLTSSRVEKARSRLEAAFPSLFDPSAEVDGYNIQQAKDVARVLMATGEREQANHLIAKALPVARLLTPSVVIYYPRLLEASLHAIAGDERQALAAIRRYFEAGGSPYTLMLQDELKPLLDNPEYQEMAVKREAELAVQLQRIREMEANGELAPIPTLPDDVAEGAIGAGGIVSVASSKSAGIAEAAYGVMDRPSDRDSGSPIEGSVPDAVHVPEAQDADFVPRTKSVAVLPFDNLSDRKEDAYRSEGIHSELITVLSRIRDVKTIARNTTMAYRDTAKPSRTIGEELGVAALLMGTVQWEEDRIRINVQLIDAAADKTLWGETYMRDLTANDIFDIQSEICTAIAGELKAVILPEELQRIATAPTQSLKALEAYFRGKEGYHFRSASAVRESIVHLEEAISLDPDFAMAHAMLGESLLRNTFYTDLPRDPEIAKAERHILKALELDDTLSEVHEALAHLRSFQGDLAGKELGYKRAIDLNPNNAQAYAVYAEILERRVGSTPEVARLWRKSYELDPNSQIAQEWLASSLAASGQLDEALKVREAIAAKNPGSARALFLLGRFYLYVLGRYDDAIVAFRKHVALDPEHKGIPDVIANAYWNLGDRERAVWWLERSSRAANDPVRRAHRRAMLLEFTGDDAWREEQALEELWASPGYRAHWWGLDILIDIYLTSNRLEKARSRLEAAHPSLFDPSAEIDGNNVRPAKDVARVLMATGEREQADHLIEEALPVARSLRPLAWYSHPRLLEAELHAIAGDERQALAAIRRYFEAGGSPYRLMLQNELKPLQNNPEYQEMAAKAKARMATQLQRIREMEAKGELAPIPQIAEGLVEE